MKTSVMGRALAEALGRCDICGGQAVKIERESEEAGTAEMVEPGRAPLPFRTHKLTGVVRRYCASHAPPKE